MVAQASQSKQTWFLMKEELGGVVMADIYKHLRLAPRSPAEALT